MTTRSRSDATNGTYVNAARRGNVTAEQEAIWAKEKAECFARNDARIVAQGVAWLTECKYSHETRAIRVAKIREKYGIRLLDLILEQFMEQLG